MSIQTLTSPSTSGSFPGTVVDAIFPSTHELLPQTNQLYELDLAYGESQTLTDSELVERGAYFRAINAKETHHYRICLATPNQVSASATRARKQFFEANVFAVGYATHGLFPYRGKFHPQMIKAIMNIIGLKPGDTILDPMAGCGTTNIEASLMGINSVGIELNPFASLMCRAKLAGLEMEDIDFDALLSHAEELARELDSAIAAQGRLLSETNVPSVLRADSSLKELVLLCYLDAMGYARRRVNKTAQQLFPELLRRYFAAVSCFNKVRTELGLTLGKSRSVTGDARQTDLPSESIDGIIFSPPYSFAIDYLDNDRLQLEFLGYDVPELKQKMVGLRVNGTGGALLERRIGTYFEDMDNVLGECGRVLRQGRCCVVVIGSNTNQTGGIYLEDRIIEIAAAHHLSLVKQVVREIEGIRNTMRDEHILFFLKQ